MKLILKKEINSVLSEVSDLVILIIENLKKLKISNNILADIEIALAEALTNIVKHGYHYENNHKIQLSLYKSKKNIILEITDYSDEVKINFNKKLEYDPKDINSLPEGGMGLYLMKNCMTTLNLKRVDNKNILIMIKEYEK